MGFEKQFKYKNKLTECNLNLLNKKLNGTFEFSNLKAPFIIKFLLYYLAD